MNTERPSEFDTHRPHLFGIAYRMLGSVADAEDAVQETYLRWQREQSETVRSPRAWLTTVVARLCLNHLNSARVRRETYVGPWLPEPLIEAQATDPAENARLADSLSVAFLVILESLSPTERAVFLLREVFGYEFNDVALAVEKSEENCRQILARARQHVLERRPRFETTPQECEQAVERFLKATSTGNLDGLLGMLAPDAKLVADGGGRVGTAKTPLEGAERIALFLAGEFRKHHRWFTRTRRMVINGQPGVLYFAGPLPVAAVSLAVNGDRVARIYIIANPDKLAQFMSWPVRLLTKVLFTAKP